MSGKRVRITAIGHERMVDILVDAERVCVQTCGFVPLAWAAGAEDGLTVCLDTPPYCILQDSTGTLWLYASEPRYKDGVVLWQRGDAITRRGETDGRVLGTEDMARHGGGTHVSGTTGQVDNGRPYLALPGVDQRA